MQVDVTESAKDISTILSRYQVLILNNSNQLTKILDQKQRKIIEEWYNKEVELLPCMLHWFDKLNGLGLVNWVDVISTVIQNI